MKTIKIDFSGFWSNFDKNDNLFVNILRERYDVQISDKPDFVIVSVLGSPYEYTKYDCVRILFTGEPLAPDFNIFDYAITLENLSCLDANGEDRHFRYPLCLYNYKRAKENSRGMSYEEAKKELSGKKYFCNFLYGHKSAYGEREELFRLVNEYKRVESAGSFMNNMPDGKVVPYSEEKMKFLKQCKFTLSVESVSYPGFITEKIINPFYSQSVPIYYGNPLCKNEFNTKAIVNCHDFNSFEEVVERVKEIDNDDELYIKMLMEHKFVTETYLDELYESLKQFLWRIFKSDKDDAYRRLRCYIAREHNENLKSFNSFHGSKLYRIHRKLVNKR